MYIAYFSICTHMLPRIGDFETVFRHKKLYCIILPGPPCYISEALRCWMWDLS